MCIQPVWDNAEHTVFRMIFMGNWSAAEFLENFDTSKQMMRAVNHPVVLILDMTGSHDLPPRFISLINHVRHQGVPDVMQAIVVSSNPPLRRIFVALQKIVPEVQQKLRFADSLDEAYRLAQTTLRQPVEAG